MKRCPSCQTQYTDDTLIYCLQDGARLADVAQTETSTITFPETETVVSLRDDTSQMSQETRWRSSEVTHIATATPQSGGSKTAIAVIAAVVGMLFIFGVIGIGAWLYLRNGRKDVANLNGGSNHAPANVSDPTFNGQVNPTPIPTIKPPASIFPGNAITIPANTSPNPPADAEQIRRDVSQRINTWKSQAESHDLGAYMDNYAGTVDYYNNHAASKDTVRNDKNRAFSRFALIRISITNMNVTADPTGERATAVFDKEWVFAGDHRSAGKVRTQLQLRKINGYWLITGEKDVKVYYTE